MFRPQRVNIRGALLTNTFRKLSQGFDKNVHSSYKLILKLIKNISYNVSICCIESVSIREIKILFFILCNSRVFQFCIYYA
jgi:hypothetical protein